MSVPSEESGMTSNPGRGVGDGVLVATNRVGAGEKVGGVIGITVWVGATSNAVGVHVSFRAGAVAVMVGTLVGFSSKPTSKVKLHDVANRGIATRLKNMRKIIKPPK